MTNCNCTRTAQECADIQKLTKQFSDRTILIAEDEITTRMIFQDLLSYHFNVITCNSKEDLMIILQCSCLELGTVIVDIHLEDDSINAIELANKFPEQKFIFMSADHEVLPPTNILGVFEKPFNVEDIINLIKK